jgi:hypothetical protein
MNPPPNIPPPSLLVPHPPAAALTAKTGAPGAPYTDADVLNFLANTECLEATYNTFAAFGQGLPASLKPGNVTGAM